MLYALTMWHWEHNNQFVGASFMELPSFPLACGTEENYNEFNYFSPA